MSLLCLLRARKRILSDQAIPPSLSVSLSASSFTIQQNGTATATVFLTRGGGYDQPATLSAPGLPTGVTATFNPSPTTAGASTMTLTALASAPTVTADAFTVQAVCSLGTFTASAAVTVTTSGATGEAPVVLSVTPSTGDPNVTRSVTFQGSEFIAGATFEVGSGSTWTAVTGVAIVNSTTATGTLPALAQGTYNVRVTTSAGVGVLVSGVSYGITLLASFSATVDGFTTKNGVELRNKRNFRLSNAISYDGTHSYMARQNEQTSQGDWIVNTELGLRFPGVNELFLSWRMYMPDGTETPSIGAAYAIPDNQRKFLRVWATAPGKSADQTYDDLFSQKMGLSTRTNGTIRSEFCRQNSETPTDRNPMGEGGTANPPDVREQVPFLGHPSYRGRWVLVQVRMRPATSVTNPNGICHVWLDGFQVINRNRISNRLDASYVDQLFTDVYILGAAEGYSDGSGRNQFQRDTTVYIDDVRLSLGGFA